jgi:hypothetical protein
MLRSLNWLCRRGRSRLGAFALLGLAAACAGADQFNPSSDLPVDQAASGDSLAPTDSAAAPVDSTLVTAPDSTLSMDTSGLALAGISRPGIAFGMYNMPAQSVTTVYNGTMQGIDPPYIMAELERVSAKGGRMILRMTGGPSTRIKNADGTFSITKWKALVNAYTKLNLTQYINNGTLIGHFLLDEPQNASRWGGKTISQSTVEALAKYSKDRWPGLTTFVRVAPTWLAKSTMTYTSLDAGWAQYAAYLGNVSTWITAEVAAAKRKGLGLATAMNMLDGGNGSSKIAGWTKGKWAMSATEVKTYGTALLNQTYACSFFGWTYIDGGAQYLARLDISSAMTALSTTARAHVKTSCRQ